MKRLLILALILAAVFGDGFGVTHAQVGRTSVLLHSAVDPTGVVTNSSAVIVGSATSYIEVQYILTTLASTSITFTAQCRLNGASTWVTLNTKTITAAGDDSYSYSAHCYEVRVGVLANGNAAGDSVSVRLDYR